MLIVFWNITNSTWMFCSLHQSVRGRLGDLEAPTQYRGETAVRPSFLHGDLIHPFVLTSVYRSLPSPDRADSACHL